MKKLSLLLFAFVLSGSVVFAQNTANTTQTGNDNTSEVTQSGSANEALVQQIDSDRSTSSISQNGADNFAFINQTGSDGSATIEQLGSGNISFGLSKAGIDDAGTANNTHALQIGDENIVETFLHKLSAGNTITINQGEEDNASSKSHAKVTTTGTDGVIDVDQGGFNQYVYLFVDADGARSDVTVSQTGSSQNYTFTYLNGTDNIVNILQDGSSNSIDVAAGNNGAGILSNSNNIDITQNGFDHESTVDVTGNGNTTTISQNGGSQ